MRAIAITVLSAACLFGAHAAMAQSPQPGTKAGPPPVTTPAPVPDVVPATPGQTSPGAIPEQIAPPAGASGPANSTPFSGTPSGQLPATGGTQTPNLAK